MLTRDEIIQLMIDREDVDTIIDMLMPTVEELVELLMDNDNIFERNYDSLVEFYEEGYG